MTVKPSDLKINAPKVDPVKRRGRTHGLGERDPKTLPDGTHRRESFEENEAGTKRWAKLGKLSRGISWTGSKY